MRKEILFAIIAGVIFGAVLAFGIWRANTALKPKVAENLSPTPTTEVGPQLTELRMTLAKPENYDVITESPTKLAGATKPGAWVAISAEEEDYIITPDESGAFEQEVDLVGGVNQIIVAVFDKEGGQINEELTLIYSTEFAKEETKESTQEE